MKKPIAYIENDAVGCFDRIANPLVLIFLLAIGVSQSTLQSLAKSWEKSIHKIRSMYGISQASYTNDYSQLLFVYNPLVTNLQNLAQEWE